MKWDTERQGHINTGTRYKRRDTGPQGHRVQDYRSAEMPVADTGIKSNRDTNIQWNKEAGTEWHRDHGDTREYVHRSHEHIKTGKRRHIDRSTQTQ